MKNNDANDFLEEGDIAGAAIATAKSKILTQVTFDLHYEFYQYPYHFLITAIYYHNFHLIF